MHVAHVSALALSMAIVAAATGAHPAGSSTTRTPVTSASAAHARMVLPFIEDDYMRAVAEARARKVPLFIEAWAPW